MITIKEQDARGIFPKAIWFERTERFRDSLIECSREELIDIALAQQEVLEDVVRNAEQAEKILGWQD